MNNLLSIKNLNVTFKDWQGKIHAVSDLNLEIHKGEILGLIGESGSGKSVTAKSVIQLVEKKNLSGQIVYQDTDLLKMSEREICKIRGNKISMVFQEPMTALNPVVKIGKQLEEILLIHNRMERSERRKKMIDILSQLNIDDPEAMLEKYPFELSGGLRQRIVIAIAVICQPELIIADEPTTALDVTTQKEILRLLKEISREMGCAILLITHDLGVIAEIADRVAVMYGGKKVEECSVEDFFSHARHPYSIGLIKSRSSNFDGRYHMVRGNVETVYGKREHCPFYNRCDQASEMCKKVMPHMKTFGNNHFAACWEIK